MATIYSTATDDELHELVAEVMRDHHPRLAEAGVSVGIQWAASDKPGRAGLRHQGYPAAATIKINGLQARLGGMADTTLTIDQAAWYRYPAARQAALIDHELTHLVPVPEKDSERCRVDDAGRPKLRLRRHDFQIGIFDEVIERHGSDALDADMLESAATRMKQLRLPFSEPQGARLAAV